MTCSKSSQTVEVTLSFSSGTTLVAGNTFQVRIQALTNPTTTAPSDSFTISIKNANSKYANVNNLDFLVNSYSTSLTLTTTSAATITTSSLTQSSNDASSDIDVTITVQLVHSVPANGMISIIYPSEVSVTSGTLAAQLVSPSVINPLALTLTSSERKIEITDMFPTGGASGATYTFTLKNIKNTATASTTSSFRLTTYVSSLGTYRIDTVSSGLTLIANCDYPCLTCSTDKTTCLSCLTATPALYLQDNT